MKFRNQQIRRGPPWLFQSFRVAAGKVWWSLYALVLMMLLTCTTFAAPPVFISNNAVDVPPVGAANSIAVIGERVTHVVTFLSDIAPSIVQVQEFDSGPVQDMALLFIPSPGVYQYRYQTVPYVEGPLNGNVPNSPFRFFLTNASGTVPCLPVSQVTLDIRPPARDGPLAMTVNGVAYTGQILHLNDVLAFSLPMNATAYQAGETANLDLSAFGFGTVALTSANPHLGNYTINTAIDPVLPGNLSFQATDPNGNATSGVALTGVVVDSQPPVISSTNVTVVPAGTARPGAQVTVSVTLAAIDTDTVTASCTYLGGTSLPLVWSAGTTYSGTFTVASSPPMTGFVGSTFVDVRVTDNGLNVATASTAPFAIDNRLPLMNPLPNAILTQISSPTGDGIGIVGDLLTIQATATWDPVQIPTAHVYADLSSLGGANQVELTKFGATTFILSYTLPAGISEESPTKSFRVWAVDTATGNTIEEWTTPLLAIDNVRPQIVSTALTRVSGTGTSYKTNDQIRIRAQVNNLSTAELGALGQVSVQIASLSLLYTNTQALNPDPGAPGFFEGVFTVGSFPPGMGWDRPPFSINVIASDHAGNIGTGTVNTGIPLDNEPVVIATTSFSFVHNQNPTIDDGYARIGDTVEFHVSLSSAPVDVVLAFVDLSGIGLSSTQAMTASAANPGGFDYTITALATGTVNRQNTIFPIRVVDNNENQDISSVTIPIDNNPPNPTSLDLAITYKSGASDLFPNFVNLNKHLAFRVPYTLDVPDDHATGTLITDIVDLVATRIMVSDLASYSTEFDTATQTVASSAYRFQARIQDDAGNVVLVQTAYYNVDCVPPVISSISASIVGGGAVATISSGIRFRVQLAGHDANQPTVNLTNIGGTSDQLMASVGSGWYEHTAIVNPGLIQDQNSTWTVSIRDANGNLVASDTNALMVDNQPPTPGPLLVSWTDVPSDGRIRLGDTASFSMTMTDTDPGTATINLTAIGTGTSVSMPFGAGSFSVELPTAITNAEYLNYVFVARVTDDNGNLATMNAVPIAEVDCQPASFSALGIAITQTNGDNPLATVANANDIITVYASISSALDAVATATIFVTGTFTESLPMTYVAVRNRHEANFTVPAGAPVGPGTWGFLSFDALGYMASATDNVGNLSGTAVQSSAPGFTVKNMAPAIGFSSFVLNPDFVNATPFLNVGSSTTGDRLLATASLAGGELVTSGNLDLSAVPGAPANVALTVGGSSAGNLAGISFTGYPLTDLIDATFTITLRDQAGNPATASQMFRVDTRRPSLPSVNFNGTTLTVNVSEEFDNLASSEWRLVGSLTNGLPAYMALSSGTITEGLFSFDDLFGITDRRTMAAWASTPLSLEITAVATAPLTDLAGNWLPGNTRFPVTITDSTWRTPAKITNFIVDTTNWPASISLDLVFDRTVASDTLIASKAVLLTSALGYEFTSIDYTTGYVFQASDTPSWPAPNQLHIELCSHARDWLARKLGSGTSVLYFANRSSISVFVQDELGRGSQVYPTSAPLPSAAIARPAPSLFTVKDPPDNLTIYLASGTLEASLAGKALLYSNDFVNIDGVAPTMGMPVPTYSRRTTKFHSKFLLYDTGPFPATFTRLTLQALELAANPEITSDTIHLRLTDPDVASILALWLSNPTPTWGMRVDAGAFANWWDQPSLLYLPSGNPGNVTVIAPASAGSAGLAAAAISDPPPTKNAVAGALAFEFDFAPALIGNVPIPIAQNIPVARIIGSASQHLATGTFQNWTTRTVAGQTRYSARFVNETPLPDGLQNWESLLEISGVTDVFGNPIALVSTSTVYNLALRSSTDVRGFSSGTAPLIIDTATPTVASILPATIARANPGALTVTVTFNEAMDTSVAPPVLTVATTTPAQSIPFNAGVWGPGGTTVSYTNSAAILPTLTPQGFWDYRLTAAGRDLAGNAFPGDSTHLVEVRTNAPPVSSTYLTLTKQSLTATPTVGLPGNVPFSPTGALGGTAIASLTYSSLPTNLPHTLRLVRPSDGASFSTGIAFTGLIGAATLSDAEFGFGLPGPYGPASYLAQVFDSAGNVVDIATFVYDSIPPDLGFLAISGAASSANGIWYATSSTALTAWVNTMTTTDDVWLTAWSATAWSGQPGIATGATATFALTQTLPGTYSGAISSGMGEGDFTLAITDGAGNVTLPPLELLLRIDRTRPTVTTIVPNTTVGNSAAGAVVCTVTFSEPMEGNLTFTPTLTLATSTPLTPPYSASTILFSFTSWVSSTTAQFTNTSAISTAYRPGLYDYSVTGGRDLAGNSTSFVAGSFNLNVQSQGPAATPIVWTLQPLISAVPTDLVGGMPAASPGSGVIELSYSGAPSNTPHDLRIYDWNGVQVATYSDIGGVIPIVGGVASVPVDAQADGWGVPPDPVGPLTYQLRLCDVLGNVSNNLGTFTYDSLQATVNTLTLSDARNGIASGGIRYYSPGSGNNLSFVAGTNATDTQRLVIATLTATMTVSMSRAGTTHSVATGSGLSDGLYNVSFADLAGNFANGAASTAVVMVDSTAPFVVNATPLSLGAVAAQTGVFQVTFSENMFAASVPTVLIATFSGPTMTLIASPAAPACWTSPTTCRFTNQTAIPSTLAPQGFYDYVVSGARDYAGNANLVPASGTVQVSIYSQAPVASLRVWTSQPLLDPPPTWIADRPFSYPANTGFASMTISYAIGPFNTPQQLLMYNAAGQNVATYAVPAVAPFEVALDPVSWPTAPAINVASGPMNFTFKLLDGLGNLSTSLTNLSGLPATLVYDSKPASVTAFVFSDPGIASGGIKYYSPALGNSTITLTTNATDPQRLVIADTTSPATWIVPLAQTPAGSVIHSVATGSGLVDGLYVFTAADLAGNFATGPARFQLVQVDASQPVVVDITPAVSGIGSPIYATSAQALTFDITFSEPMSSGTVPVVKLVNGSFQTTLIASPTAPACWISSATCRFRNGEAIVGTFPQGIYNYVVTGGRDYAGNTSVTSNGAFQLEILSRGPKVTSYLTQSQQDTTASGTRILENQPFSHLIGPNAATLTVTLETASGTPGTRVHFYQGGASVASVALNWDVALTVGTFTWDATTGPIPVNGSPYTLKMIDGNGNSSLETWSWTMDATAPRVLATPTVSDLSTTTQLIHFSPTVTPNVSFSFWSSDASGLRLRLTGGNATDTWAMVKGAGTLWTSSFAGRFTDTMIATDGTYQFDVVDLAGNIGVADPGIGTSVVVIVDTIVPVVSSYTLRVGGAGNHVTRFAAQNASLAIELTLDPATPFTASGVWAVDVLNDLGQTINRLPLVASGAIPVAWWNGTNFAGTTVLDGTYTFRARDMAGNRSAQTVSVFAVTSPFKLLGGAEVTSSSIQLFFNHPVGASSLPGAICTFAPTVPGGPAVSSFTFVTQQTLIASLVPALTDGIAYQFEIATLTLRDADGAPLTQGQAGFSFVADAVGPRLATPAVSFTGITNARQFYVNFTEIVTLPTAVATDSYQLSAGTIPVTAVSLQSNRTSVLVTVASDLSAGQNYQLQVNGVEDQFRNLSLGALAQATFTGRDQTPPVFSMAVFSNPANEYDIMVAGTVNETLAANPTLEVTQNSAQPVETTMLSGTIANSYMQGVHLDPNFPGNGVAVVRGSDLAGNAGTGSIEFALAVVNASIRAEVQSPDRLFTGIFPVGCFTQKTAVKWLSRGDLKKNAVASILASSVLKKSKAKAAVSRNLVAQGKELEAWGTINELAIPSGRLLKPYALQVRNLPLEKKWGLYLQASDGGWTWQASISASGTVSSVTQPGVLGIFCDSLAPRVTLNTVFPETPLTDPRPLIEGAIEEYGSGLVGNSVEIVLDGVAQPASLLTSSGTFRFQPLSSLSSGKHELVIRARDQGGNIGESAKIQFAVLASLQIAEMVTFPNPARERVTLRVTANRDDLALDALTIKIFDVSGDRVMELSGLAPRLENGIYRYEIPWDLRNEDGRKVANGVYLARMEIIDPENPQKKIKKTHKIVVLR